MLTALSIRDVVLIDRLDLSFGDGLCVLTGETGAGKSILLDSLGLALGSRADSALLRRDAERASVTAAFDVPADHPVRDILDQQGLDARAGDLVLRRVLGADGRSRAFVNDQPASVGLLREIGESLIEIQGQFEPRGLIDPATQRALLDAFGDLDALAAATRRGHAAWHAARQAREQAAVEAEAAERDRAWLAHAVDELTTLDPRPGEEAALAESRTRLMHGEQLVQALNAALGELGGGQGVEDAVQAAQKHLARVVDKAGGTLDAAVEALDRVAVELQEAFRALEAAGAAIDPDQGGLEGIEERLFALRDVARKHRVGVDELAALRDSLAGRLELAEDRAGAVARRAEAESQARAAYLSDAQALGAERRAAAIRLDAAVNRELPPLRLEKARFRTVIDPLGEEDWGADGCDRIGFRVSTNPGTPEGPLAKVASGGELSRIMLALKVAAARPGGVPTLVFDEVDANIGGATADAVGERLARLARDLQVLVVTHSPQVAARGDDHLRVEKNDVGQTTMTRVTRLTVQERREEVARMLSGATITDEARAAADRLIQGADA